MDTCQYRNYRLSLSQQDTIVLPSVLFLHSLLERSTGICFLLFSLFGESDTA